MSAAISLEAIRAAAERLRGLAVRTPLLRLNVAADEAPGEIYLKLENLQPIGSFKIRGAANATALADPAARAEGLWTASAGNMAQGVAWCARHYGVEASVVVPETAPAAKLDALARLGASVLKVPVDEWLEVFSTRHHPAMRGLFIHAFSDEDVMAGNGTIGLEILEDLPDVDAVIVPYGGGGLACGIASALDALAPGVPVYAAEVETGAPVAAAFENGEPVEVEFRPGWVDGIGAPHVFPEMWERAKELLSGALVMGEDEIAEAVRLLVTRNRVVAEGAGASSVAAALTGATGGDKVVCVVSGGNIDAALLARLLSGDAP